MISPTPPRRPSMLDRFDELHAAFEAFWAEVKRASGFDWLVERLLRWWGP